MNQTAITLLSCKLAEDFFITKNNKEIKKILSLKLSKESITFLMKNYQININNINDLELFKLTFEQTIDNYNELTNSYKNIELF